MSIIDINDELARRAFEEEPVDKYKDCEAVLLTRTPRGYLAHGSCPNGFSFEIGAISLKHLLDSLESGGF